MMAATERLCEGMTSKGRLCKQPAAIASRFCGVSRSEPDDQHEVEQGDGSNDTG
jgi:hypothetical protein